jgi:hypothetical protein
MEQVLVGQTMVRQKPVGQKSIYLKSGPLKASEVALRGDGSTVYIRFKKLIVAEAR